MAYQEGSFPGLVSPHPCEKGHRSCVPPFGTVGTQGSTAEIGVICFCLGGGGSQCFPKDFVCSTHYLGPPSNRLVGVRVCGLSPPAWSRLQALYTLFQRKKGRLRLRKGGRGPKTPPLLFSTAVFPDRQEGPRPQEGVVVKSGRAQPVQM